MRGLKNYAPNLAGTFYTIGNLLLFIAGGSAENYWLLAAGLFWLIDGIILGWFGRKARGIEIHAGLNMAGNLCLLLAAIGLVDPFGQMGLAWFLIAAASVKILAPPADAPLLSPTAAWRLPWYWAMRYPLPTVGALAAISRVFGIWGAVTNGQTLLLVCVGLWFLGDIMQMLSQKGGYAKIETKT